MEGQGSQSFKTQAVETAKSLGKELGRVGLPLFTTVMIAACSKDATPTPAVTTNVPETPTPISTPAPEQTPVPVHLVETATSTPIPEPTEVFPIKLSAEEFLNLAVEDTEGNSPFVREIFPPYRDPQVFGEIFPFHRFPIVLETEDAKTTNESPTKVTKGDLTQITAKLAEINVTRLEGADLVFYIRDEKYSFHIDWLTYNYMLNWNGADPSRLSNFVPPNDSIVESINNYNAWVSMIFSKSKEGISLDQIIATDITRESPEDFFFNRHKLVAAEGQEDAVSGITQKLIQIYQIASEQDNPDVNYKNLNALLFYLGEYIEVDENGTTVLIENPRVIQDIAAETSFEDVFGEFKSSELFAELQSNFSWEGFYSLRLDLSRIYGSSRDNPKVVAEITAFYKAYSDFIKNLMKQNGVELSNDTFIRPAWENIPH